MFHNNAKADQTNQLFDFQQFNSVPEKSNCGVSPHIEGNDYKF